MNIQQKRFVFSVLWAVQSLAFHAQPNHTIITRLIDQLSAFRQEKTYVHTDRTDYRPGDRMWLKVYLVDALSHVPVTESRYVYVELISPVGVIESRVKLICREGVYAGYLDIPAGAAGGSYRLRSYTEWMANVPDYVGLKTVYIGRKTTPRPIQYAAARTYGPVAGPLQYRKADGRIKVTTSAHDDSLCLVAHCRAYPFFIGKISYRRPVVFLEDSIPQGIVELLLIDRQLNIVDRLQFYSDNDRERCRLQIATDEAVHAPNDSVTLQLSIPELHDNERADISVSVTSVPPGAVHKPSSILSHLFLATDMAGGLENPEQFEGCALRVDSLLRSQRWTRYDLSKVLKGHYAQPAHEREQSNSISGSVRSLLFKKPVAGATVSLISLQTGIYAETTTDGAGRFRFQNLDFPEHTQYVLRALKPKGSDRVELLIDERAALPFSASAVVNDGGERMDMAADSLTETPSDAIVLDDVEVTAKRHSASSKADAYARLADFSFGTQQIKEMDATCLHEVIRRIPSVFIRENKCYIRATSSINEDHPAAVVIDGVFVESDYDLDNIQMQDVARVDVFKTGSTAIWGTRGGSGVISITSKAGNYGIVDVEQLNQKKVSPLGYQRPEAFSRHAVGTRKTLYWNPNVTAETLRFGTNNATGRYLVVLEGVTNEGRLIHEEQEIGVQ